MPVILCTECMTVDYDLDTNECVKCKTDVYLMEVEESKL